MWSSSEWSVGWNFTREHAMAILDFHSLTERSELETQQVTHPQTSNLKLVTRNRNCYSSFTGTTSQFVATTLKSGSCWHCVTCYHTQTFTVCVVILALPSLPWIHPCVNTGQIFYEFSLESLSLSFTNLLKSVKVQDLDRIKCGPESVFVCLPNKLVIYLQCFYDSVRYFFVSIKVWRTFLKMKEIEENRYVLLTCVINAQW